MMLGAAPISAGLIETLPQIGPVTAVGDQAQFQQNLVQTAASKGADALSAPGSAAPIPPTSEVQRTTTQTSSLGERILQNLSAVHRGGGAPPAGGTEPAIVKSSQSGPAEQSLQHGGAGPRMQGKPQGSDNFEAMVAMLHSVYNNVIQVSLVSKSTGSFSSSLNKLMSAG